MLVSHLGFMFSYHGTVCKAPANCSDPKRVSGLPGAGRCGPQQLPGLRRLSSDTPRREGGSPRTSYSPCANGCCTHGVLPTGYLPGASACASHSTSVRVLPAHYSRKFTREWLAVCHDMVTGIFPFPSVVAEFLL